MTTAPTHPVPVLLLLSAVAASTLVAPAAHAAQRSDAGSPAEISLPAGDPTNAPRVQLPAAVGRAQRSAVGGAGSARHWLLGTSGDDAKLRRIAARFGGSYDAGLQLIRVPAARGDAAATALGDQLRWAGPDVAAGRTSSLDDPGTTSPWARGAAAAPSFGPAPLAPIGIVDDAVDHSVAELAGTDVINGVAPQEPHGTMVASTAAAPYDARGVVGVAPGAKILSWGTSLSCSDVSSGIRQVVRRGAKVVNLSLGFDTSCWPLFEQIAYAYTRGVTVIAASGNDGDNGNPLAFPASYPHVITAGAITPTYTHASFSNHNSWVDLAAPGVDVPVDIPVAADLDDGVADGRTLVSGTSFAAPFVSGGVSWLLGQRPNLDPSQVAAIMRGAARDLETPGWDQYTGFGLVQVTPALGTATPPADRYEPNDDPAIVRSSGTFRQPTVWRGGKARTITATGDSADDAVDAYRVKVPAGGRVRVSLRASEGYTNLFAFSTRIDQFADRKPLTSSTRGGTRTDRITLRNRSSHARTYFVVVNTVSPKGDRGLARYQLKLSR